ncbi:MAG: 5-bromo-4-chloroindolyl phosphate hydrolysis family protein [Defluviimonas sp.]|nr:5-bromo-4-chloroindolyl phosphate hydrolysis family protein [Defluviimonas sp.]
MAQRFGARHSPGGEAGTRPEPAPAGLRQARGPEPMRARRNLLFLAPVPLLFTAFSGGALGLAADLGALAILWGGAWLTSEGVRAQAAFDARAAARRPAIPRKLFGAVLTGIGVALAAVDPAAAPAAAEPGAMLAPAIFGVVAAALHVLAFGVDPLRDKRAAGADAFQSGRVARVLEEGERHLAAMREAIGRTGEQVLIARVARFEATVREMFARVESDPRDLTAARRWLGVYLEGARNATAKFADLWLRSRDAAARAQYEGFLDELEASFAARSQTLLTDDRTDLTVEIDVLRERLAREGLLRDGAETRT